MIYLIETLDKFIYLIVNLIFVYHLYERLTYKNNPFNASFRYNQIFQCQKMFQKKKKRKEKREELKSLILLNVKFASNEYLI